MPNFAILFPALVYVPAIILVLVAVIVWVTHCIIAWPVRSPAALSAGQGQVRVPNAVRKSALSKGRPHRGINAAI